MDTAKSNRDMCCASIAFIYLVSLGQFIQTNSNPVNGVMTDPKRGRRVQIEEKKKDRSMVTGGWFRKLSVGGSGHRRPWKLLGLAASWRPNCNTTVSLSQALRPLWHDHERKSTSTANAHAAEEISFANLLLNDQVPWEAEEYSSSLPSRPEKVEICPISKLPEGA
ncbi:hypothetical protein ZIOFF_025309 [Zingiber officinale]|uniref:Uncharacterized protein n=1 Tax=Zingiber officinale TaxID=94328 RepID=A0A8J5H0Z5_ZINOF|nr:hypothetical protein ZIOFF_025309 [Zingiber officinale]